MKRNDNVMMINKYIEQNILTEYYDSFKWGYRIELVLHVHTSQYIEA